MSEQVPEGKVPSREEQLSSLRQKLLGNQAFADCRGRFGFDTLLKVVEEADSPTQFCAKWDALSASARIMGNLLAQYRRDGWTQAYGVLKSALARRAYLLPGETIPLDQTTPLTLVILNPEVTLTVINWLLNIPSQELEYLNFLDENYHSGCHGRYEFHPSGLTCRLAEVLPSLKERADDLGHPKWGFPSNKGRILSEAYCHDVYEKMESFLAGTNRILNICASGMKSVEFSLRFGQWDFEGLSLGIDQCVFAQLYQAEAKQVLSFFSRVQQDYLAVWSFDFPSVSIDPDLNVAVGLHHEREHERWRKEAPMQVSRNVSHGYGAVLEPHCLGDDYTLVKDGGVRNEGWWEDSHQPTELALRFLLVPKE